MFRPRLIVLASIAGLTAWVFAEVLFRGGMFAFRDAAHFYYPLFEFIRNEWAAGRVPLWNPYEDLGMPLAANPAASVFYPGKLIFALPLDFAWAYRLYILGHVLLAAAAAWLLARRWKASTLAAGVCAISYAFCGNVLAQHANVIYLVGAAWLPAAVLAADRMLRGRSPRAALALGVVLALMVLGGDPQMAYHAGLLAALYALILWRRDLVAGTLRVPSALAAGTRRVPRRTARGACLLPRLVLLAAAAIVGLVLSAVQVLPSMEFAARSDRASADVARNLYEVPRQLGGEDAPRRVADGLLCRHLEPGTHHEVVYHFSVGPWRLVEYLWPNVSGRQYPVHRRWLDVVPAEARVWTPSLYMGLLPLVLAVRAMRLRRGRPRDRWLTWAAVLAVVASFGWFGLGWLVHEVRVAAGGDPASWPVGAPVGGLYWLLTVLLPGYVQFRYPAKLLVVAALALSVLAARGWDRAFTGDALGLRRALLVLGGLSLVGALAALAVGPFWRDWLAGVEPDALFGPLDADGAYRDLLGGFVQTALLCGILWCMLRRIVRGRRTGWVPAAALVLVALDLALANGWVVACAPAELWRGPSRLADAMAAQQKQQAASRTLPVSGTLHDDSPVPVRVFRRPVWLPPAWRLHGSPDRLAEAVRWDRDMLWPKYNLAAGVAMVDVGGTLALSDYVDWVQSARRSPGGSAEVPASWFLDPAGADYLILRGSETPPPDRRLTPIDRALDGAEDFSLWQNPHAWARAWARVDDRTLRACRIVHFDPLRVEVEAELAQPGLVVLAEQFYPGWRLDVQTEGQGSRPVQILPAHDLMRGVSLPHGRHRLIYRYRPVKFFYGATASAMGWLGLAGAVIALRIGRRRAAGMSRLL